MVMPRSLRRLSVLALAFLSALAAPAAAHARLTVGIAEQHATAFSDPRLDALGLTHARYVVPFDVALRHGAPRRQFDAWLAAVGAQHMRPLVAFTSDHKAKPSVARYRQAMRAFHRAYPQVRELSTWNEPNLTSLAHRPRVAAGYYLALRSVCPSCQVLAAEVVDHPGMTQFLRAFRRYAPHARLWGLHNYLDANYGRSSGTRRMLAAVPGQVWVTEVGGIIRTRGRRFSEAHQAASVRRAFTLARAHPRITRLYVYHWNDGRPRWDSGLIAPSGRARPALSALRSELRRGR
jgi:hypothetical protein